MKRNIVKSKLINMLLRNRTIYSDIQINCAHREAMRDND